MVLNIIAAVPAPLGAGDRADMWIQYRIG